MGRTELSASELSSSSLPSSTSSMSSSSYVKMLALSRLPAFSGRLPRRGMAFEEALRLRLRPAKGCVARVARELALEPVLEEVPDRGTLKAVMMLPACEVERLRLPQHRTLGMPQRS